ncbi:MAG TPA: AsmA-like C-terminal domain-containing protein [Alphaproteobacteria bacterium]|nr:AsmA-like C-terminal domain-containing protein [Alphaproteobacteria bacterium]HQS94488.1 AsmA-like C-terminal domain-containing protein [Alphaproteobacteria bacterium]
MVFVRGVFRVFSSLFLSLMKFFFISLGILLMGIIFLSLRLSLGPLDITFLKTFIGTETVQKTLSMEMDRIFLKYNGVYDPLTVLVEGVTFFQDDHSVFLKIPKIRIHADYGSLLKGNLKLRSIGLLEPELSLSLETEKTVQFKETNENSETFLVLGVLTAFAGGQMLPLERKSTNVQKIVQNLEEISIENGKLNISQKGKALTLQATLNARLIHEKEQDSFLKFNIKLDDVSLCFPSLDKRTFLIPELSLFGSFEGALQTLEFTVSTFDWQGTGARAKGNGQVSETGKIEINIDFEAEALPLNRFYAVWPENLAESTRSWILENLSQGDIDHIAVHLKAETSPLYEKEKSFFFNITKVEGGFNLNKIDVQYIEGLPPATDVFGVARFDNDTFDIEILKGHLEEIKVTKGLIHFYDLSQEDEMAEINLTLNGALQKILEVIDKKPLQYPTQLGIHPKEFQGMATVNLLLKFPLLRYLTLDEISVSTKSFLENVSYTHFFEQKTNGKVVKRNLKIESGSFDLDVDKLHLFLTGNGDLKGIKTHISWTEIFKNQGAFSRKLSLKGEYPLSFFEDFGLFLNKFMTGNLGLRLLMVEKEGHFLEIDVKGDLKNVDIKIPEINVHKKREEPGALSFIVKLPSSHKKNVKRTLIFSNIFFESPSAFIKGSAALDAETQEIIKVDLSSFRTPRNNMMFLMEKCSQNFYQVKIRGKEIDASWFFKEQETSSKTTVSSKKVDATDIFPDLNLDLVLDHLWLKGDEFVKSVNLDLKRVKNRLERVVSRGKLKERGAFDLAYSHVKGESGHSLYLQTSNAGEFLRAIDLYDHMEGGKLQVDAKKSSLDFDAFLEGKALLEDFRILKTPVVAKVLSLASLEWMSDALKEKKGMLFRNATLEFKINDHKLEILHGLAENSSTGVTLKGEMDRSEKILNFQGTIIPVYMFNSLIGKIPILGDILSGGVGKGFLAVTYDIKGPVDHPEVHVNPFSIFAPGFLRELF